MTTTNDTQFVFTKITVADIDSAFAFYSNVFGLVEIARISDGEGEMEMHEVIMGRAGEQGMPVPSLMAQCFPNKLLPPLDGVALGFTTTDIDATIAKAVAAGASVIAPPTTNVEYQLKSAVLVDPQGATIELLQYL
jgi:predicted enzyme related to lactoylglutathione lyase